jgi:hypothetical protein
MVQPNLGLRLRDKLGPEATQDLSHAFDEVQQAMLTMTGERFEGRLTAVGSELRGEMARMDSGLRIALTDGLAKIRMDLSDSRADVLRWSFIFWIGQFTATVALIVLLLRLSGR